MSSNIFESMFLMLESKQDDQLNIKENKDSKQGPSISKRSNRHDKPNLFELMKLSSAEKKIKKDHKSAIDNFAKNLSKLSFKNAKQTDKCSDSDGIKSDISALKKLDDAHESDIEDGSDIDDFMVVDEASSSDEDADSDDNNETKIKNLDNIPETSTLGLCTTSQISMKNRCTDMNVMKSSEKSLELNKSNETVYSDVTSDESGEIHSDDNCLDVSDEENSFLKRKEPKVIPTKVTYTELLAKELQLRKLKSQPKSDMLKVQSKRKKEGAFKQEVSQREYIEKFLAEQRHVSSSHQKIQDKTSTSVMGSEKFSSLRIEMIDGAKRRISIVDDKTTFKQSNETTEKQNDTSANNLVTDSHKSKKSNSTNSHSDSEDTYLSLEGLIVVDEAGCESSEHEDEDEFEVIDSCLDIDEGEEKESSPQIDVEKERAPTPQDDMEKVNDLLPSVSFEDQECDSDDSNDSFSNAMIIDEVTSPEVEDLAKKKSHENSENDGKIVNNQNTENIARNEEEDKEKKSDFEKINSVESDKNSVSFSKDNTVIEQNSSFNCNEYDMDSGSDEPKSLVIDESNNEPENSSESLFGNKMEKMHSDLVNTGRSPKTDTNKSPTMSMKLYVQEEVDSNCESAFKTVNDAPENCDDTKKQLLSEFDSQTDFSLSKFQNQKEAAPFETSKSHDQKNKTENDSIATSESLINSSSNCTTSHSEESRSATKLGTSLEKYSSKTLSVPKHPNSSNCTSPKLLQRYYTTKVVRLDSIEKENVTKRKNNLANSEILQQKSGNSFKSTTELDSSMETKESSLTGSSDKSKTNICRVDSILEKEFAQDDIDASSTGRVVKRYRSSSIADVATTTSLSFSHVTLPSTSRTSSSVVTTLSKVSLSSHLNCLSSNVLTSSVGGTKSLSTEILKSSETKQKASPVDIDEASSKSEKVTLLKTAMKDSSTMTTSFEECLSSNTALLPSSSQSMLPSSAGGLTTKLKNSPVTTTSMSSDNRFSKSAMPLINQESTVSNIPQQAKTVYLSPPLVNYGQNPQDMLTNISSSLIAVKANRTPISPVVLGAASKPCIVLSSGNKSMSAPGENQVTILSAKDDIPVTQVQRSMHSLIHPPIAGSNQSPSIQPTSSSVKYLITLKKCDKNGSEVDNQPETILTSDLVQSLTEIGTTSVVNCQKLVISPGKTIKVIPGRPKSSTPVGNVQVANPASSLSNGADDPLNSRNIMKEFPSLPTPPPLIKCPNVHPKEPASDPLAAVTAESSPSSLLNVDYSQPIVMSSSAIQYHNITGSLKQKDATIQSDETPFKILKISDSALEEVSKKKKKVRNRTKELSANQSVYAYPVNYDLAEEYLKREQKETRKTSKRSMKNNPVSLELAKSMTNRQLYMPPKEKQENFRGRFLVGKVKGAYICFKCKSKFSDMKYFRWHLWYHIHLHSDYCPACDSQDPLGNCTTTDSLLQKVVALENEQIFYVMTKGENANYFETYKSLSEVAGNVYPPEKVNSELLLSNALTLTTRMDSDVINEARSEHNLKDTTEELHPESVNLNNDLSPEDSANIETEDDNFMGLKILNTFSLSGTDVDFPCSSSVVDPELLVNQNLTSNILVPVPNSNTLDTNICRSTSPISTNHNSGSFYKCSFCDYSTLFPSEFRNHVYAYHMNSKTYKCFYCDFACVGAGNYINHYRDHVDCVKEDCAFVCTFPGCEDKVNRLEQHLKHLESHEKWKPVCCQCSMEFPSLMSLSEHYKKKLISLFSCQYCDAKAVDKKTYLSHVSQIHSLKAKMVMVRKTLICHLKELSLSKNVVSSQKPSPQTKDLLPSSDVCFSTFICQKCSFVCNDKSEFLNHKRIHSCPETDLNRLKFMCPSCPAAYSTLDDLWDHLHYHDEVIEFYIYKCPDDDFITNDHERARHHCTMLQHNINHIVKQSTIIHKNSIHYCKLCDIKVKERDIFLRHLSIHGKTGERIAQSLLPLADFDISPCIKPTLVVKPSPVQPITPVSKSLMITSPKKVCHLTEPQRIVASNEPSSEVEEQLTSEEFLKQKKSLNKPIPVVSNPVNMVVQASPTYRYSAQILDQKLKDLYTHKSGFFVCLICQSLFRVKNLLSNHIVEHLEMPYQCCKCGFQNTSYDAAIAHALKSHNMERINIIYSEAINDKITKMALSLNAKSTNVSQSAREEFSKRVNMLRQHKTFQNGNKTKSKVFTSSIPSSSDVSPNFKDAEEHRMEKACRSMSAQECEKMAFLQEAETTTALMKLCKRGTESNWCRICSKPFSKSSLADIFIKEHILITHLKYKPYKCQHCDFSAFSWKSFSIHSRTVHAGVSSFMEDRDIGKLVDLFIKAENILVEVEVFSDNQEDANALDEDLGVEEPPSKTSNLPTTSCYICEHCNTKFDCPFKMLRHKKLAHAKTSSNTARKSTTPTADTVQQLLRQSSKTSSPSRSARKLTTKAANNHPLKSGSQCARKSTCSNRRGGHQEKKVLHIAKTTEVLDTCTPKFVCQKCDFVTEKRKRAMIYHFKKHGFECFVECNNCQAKYTSMRLLLKHFELIHKGKELHPNYLPIESYFQPISTDEISVLKANKQNVSRAALDVVKATKSLPPFKCVFCDLEEIKEEFMRYHLYIHLDYKPFKCDQCTKAFSDPFQQKQHVNGDHTQKAKSLFDKMDIYEEKVSEILIDCRRTVQKQQSFRPWDLEVVQNQLLEEYINPVNWGNDGKEKDEEKKDEENIGVKEEHDIKPGEYLVTLSSQSTSLISNNSNYSDESFSYDSELPDLDVDIKPTVDKNTLALADCVALKRKSTGPDSPGYTNKQPKVIKSNTKSKKKNLIESVIGVLGKEAKKKPKAAKRTLDSEPETSSNKKPKYSGEFDAEVILCYYCSFMSESITAVISHTHDIHLGSRRKNSAVGMLWVDTITGGTYDFEGHIFSNGFDTNIAIDFPYLCGTCNYRSTELNDIYEHEQIQHLDLRSSRAFVIKKSQATSGGRGRSTVSYCETNRRKPNLNNSNSKSKQAPKKGSNKPAPKKDKVPATESCSISSSTTSTMPMVSSLTPSGSVLDSSSSSLDTSITSNMDCAGLQYRCLRCNTICHSEYGYRQHLATHKTFKCLVPDLARNPKLKCEICSYRAPKAVNFTKHMISHNGPAVKFLCGYCGFKATNTRAIKIHHHKRHENQSFDITKFVDKKSSYKNHSLIVDLEPQVKLENILEMSQERFSCILNTMGNVSFEVEM